MIKEVIGMLNKQNDWRIVSCYCPNCGKLLSGHPSEEGNVKISCRKCGADVVLKVKGRRHTTLEIYAPKNAIEGAFVCRF